VRAVASIQKTRWFYDGYRAPEHDDCAVAPAGFHRESIKVRHLVDCDELLPSAKRSSRRERTCKYWRSWRSVDTRLWSWVCHLVTMAHLLNASGRFLQPKDLRLGIQLSFPGMTEQSYLLCPQRNPWIYGGGGALKSVEAMIGQTLGRSIDRKPETISEIILFSSLEGFSTFQKSLV